MPDLESLDWSALDRLRAIFLARDAASAGPYWQNHDTLAAYDATYAERIGWKWDALLRELRLRRWAPPAGTVLLDYGCGSGVAGRRVLAAFGPERFAGLALHDHSAEAVAFAAGRAEAEFPALPRVPLSLAAPDRPFTLVVSHVLNELPPAAREELVSLAASAAAVIWVEPGTHADSRALAEVRDTLRIQHRIVAPCTHRENCPLFAETNAREWCHYFAEPPVGVQNDSAWVRFAQRAGVDLRSQAYSCLVLERGDGLAPDATSSFPAPGSALHPARVLGRPEVFKPYARLLACDAAGLHWLELPKRVDPALVKRLDKKPPVPLYALAHDGKRIASAAPLVADSAG
jgi:Predicted rRNA methylase